MLVVLNLCMVFGLEGFDVGDKEADEYPIKAASDGKQGDEVHDCVNDALKFVHGFGGLVAEHIVGHLAILEYPMAFDIGIDFFVNVDFVKVLQ